LDIQRDFPPGNWRPAVFAYVRNAEVFVCPSTRYCYHFDEMLYGKKLAQIARPDLTAAIYDYGWQDGYAPPPHNNGYNVGYADGHVRWNSRMLRSR
jgi:prepilin-type processing-associated H-X9-DG protein